jgi:hypothetical protein
MFIYLLEEQKFILRKGIVCVINIYYVMRNSHYLYLPCIIMIISLTRMGWVRHVADMGGKRAAYRKMR